MLGSAFAQPAKVAQVMEIFRTKAEKIGRRAEVRHRFFFRSCEEDAVV